jgi:hypothetical protein
MLGVSVCLRRPKRSEPLLSYQSDCQRWEKRALKVSLLCRGLPVFRRKGTLCDKILMGKGSLHVKPSSTSDKRDDVLPARYVLAGVPFVILRIGPLAPVVSGGCPEVWRFASCQNCLNREDA